MVLELLLKGNGSEVAFETKTTFCCGFWDEGGSAQSLQLSRRGRNSTGIQPCRRPVAVGEVI